MVSTPPFEQRCWFNQTENRLFPASFTYLFFNPNKSFVGETQPAEVIGSGSGISYDPCFKACEIIPKNNLGSETVHVTPSTYRGQQSVGVSPSLATTIPVKILLNGRHASSFTLEVFQIPRCAEWDERNIYLYLMA